MIECYLGLGANQQDPVRVFHQAKDLISCLPNTQMGKTSKIIITEPFGILGQPIFYNQVIQIFTSIPPLALLKKVLAIESRLGKIRNLAWGPRRIDIDLLIYGKTLMKSAKLTLPHPQIWQRRFVSSQLQEFQSELVESYFLHDLDIYSFLDSKKPKNLPNPAKALFDMALD